MSPRISVVVPLYNKRAHVAETLGSVCAQSCDDFEVIVVDDGSTDGSAEVAAALGNPRIRIVRQANAGVSVARNRGILEAAAPWIAFLDADDVWDPLFLETILDVAGRHPAAGMIALPYRVQDGDELLDPLAGLLPSGQAEAVLDFFEASRDRPAAHASSVAVRRDVFSRSGLFPPGITHGEDLDTWLRVALAAGPGGFVFTTRSHAVWRWDTEARAGHRPVRAECLPDVRWVTSGRGRFAPAVREYAFYMLLCQARRLTSAGQRSQALARLWRVRTTRWHRAFALREIAKALGASKLRAAG